MQWHFTWKSNFISYNVADFCRKVYHFVNISNYLTVIVRWKNTNKTLLFCIMFATFFRWTAIISGLIDYNRDANICQVFQQKIYPFRIIESIYSRFLYPFYSRHSISPNKLLSFEKVNDKRVWWTNFQPLLNLRKRFANYHFGNFIKSSYFIRGKNSQTTDH